MCIAMGLENQSTMLTDPLILSSLDLPVSSLTTGISLGLQDLAPGKTVRIARVGTGETFPESNAVLTIAHSESRENKNQVTDRTSIRLEGRKTLESGETSTAQVTVTVSYPRLGWTDADMLMILQNLVGTLVATVDSEDASNYLRVLHGEP